MKTLTTTLAGFALLAPAFGLINFEMGSDITTGSFNPSDNLDVSSTIFESGAADIQFSLSSSQVPTVEDANTGELNEGGGFEGATDGLGFVTVNTPGGSELADEERGPLGGASGLGDFFLRSSDNANFEELTIDYVNGTSSTGLGFQIWDIDGSIGGDEQFIVEFFDGTSDPLNPVSLGIVETPVGDDSSVGSLDGRPFAVNFTADAGEAITQVVVSFATGPGFKTTGVGLAFDNFDPEGTIVPEPAALGGLFGCAALLIARRRIA